MNKITDPFDNLDEDSYYYFNYGHLTIEMLGELFGCESDKILYKNCVLHGYQRVFCVNEPNDTNSIASVHENMWEKVYGLIILINSNQLDKLRTYYKNYDLFYIDVKLTYSMAPRDIPDDDIYDYCSRKTYFFVHKNIINEEEIKPTKEYVKSIRNMLNDRKKLDPNIVTRPITINCVKKYQENEENHNYIELIDFEDNFV